MAQGAEQRRDADHRQAADDEMVQMPVAEVVDCLHPIALAQTIAPSATAGVPFLMHLMAKLPPRVTPRLVATVTSAEVFDFGSGFRFGAIFFVDREIFPDADADFAHRASTIGTWALYFRCSVEAYIINTSSNVKPCPRGKLNPMEGFAKMLTGGDRRSIGKADAVVKRVRGAPQRFEELWACLRHSDPVVRMRAADAMVPVGHLRTMDQIVSGSLARQNFNTLLLTLFAAIAMLLEAIGMYGLIAYTVEQRTQEIGIRVALGAARGQVLRMIVLDGAKLAAIGVAAGLAVAFGVTRLLASLLYGVKAADPLTFAGAAVAIGVVALAASYIPALRAAAVDPIRALRHE